VIPVSSCNNLLDGCELAAYTIKHIHTVCNFLSENSIAISICNTLICVVSYYFERWWNNNATYARSGLIDWLLIGECLVLVKLHCNWEIWKQILRIFLSRINQYSVKKLAFDNPLSNCEPYSKSHHQQQQPRSVIESRVQAFILEGIEEHFIASNNEEHGLADFISDRNMVINEHNDNYTIETEESFFLARYCSHGSGSNCTCWSGSTHHDTRWKNQNNFGKTA